MKRWMKAAVALVAFLSLTSGAHAYIETFDSDNAGWTTYTIATPTDSGHLSGTTGGSAFSSTGGNPGGYISGSVGSSIYNRLYSFEAPAGAFGDLGSKMLTVDYQSTGTVTGPTGGTTGPSVRFYIGVSGNYFVSSSSWAANTNGSWTTHALSVDTSNFMAWPNQNNGTMTLAQVAASSGYYVGLLFSNGDFSSNSSLGFTSTNGATIAIDNFGTPSAVPIPAAIWLLGSGLVGLVGLRRRIKP